MPVLSEYEKLRQKNIEENRKILQELGLLNAFSSHFKVIKKPTKRKRAPSTPYKKKVIIKENDSSDDKGSSFTTGVRRSSRLLGKDVPSLEEMEEELKKSSAEDGEYRRTKVQPNRPNFYGIVPGVEVGTLWQTRMECCYAGIHRPTVAGIHGGEDGAYSIALSGGYEDNIDLGCSFTYTGEGGRDLKGTKNNPKNLRTAPQSKDQILARGNLALSRSVETGNPVRVIRGYKLNSPFAPEEGYRYDGIYKVVKYWFTIGLSGFGVYKFALSRIEDQPSPPWEVEHFDKGMPKPDPAIMDEDSRSDSAYGSHGDKSDTESVQSKDTSEKDDRSDVSSPSDGDHDDIKEEKNEDDTSVTKDEIDNKPDASTKSESNHDNSGKSDEDETIDDKKRDENA
ncbi:uncharacterized protein LOC144445636 [Glandiceps talaboti]